MKIHALLVEGFNHYDPESCHPVYKKYIYGIYKTKELAEEWAKKVRQEYGNETDIEIEEHEVIKEMK